MLAAIQRQRPGDVEALLIAHHHFACSQEMAAGLHARARASSPSPPTQNRLHHLKTPASQHAAVLILKVLICRVPLWIPCSVIAMARARPAWSLRQGMSSAVTGEG